MATVELLQTTDMNTIPSTLPAGSSSDAIATEIDFSLGSGSAGGHMFLYGSFGTFSTPGTITHALIDTPDLQTAPNLDITDLSFTTTNDMLGELSTPADFVAEMLAGNDTFLGSTGADTILGFDGNDVLNGGLGADTLVGGKGDDWYFVDTDDAIVELSGEGTLDRVFASVSFNLPTASAIEIVSTANHAGTEGINLRGNQFAQTIFGNAGTNIISGGLGNDTLMGLGGNDYFLFEKAPGAGNVDQIGDFSPGQDHVLMAQSVFTSLSVGVLSDANFMIRGTAFQDANDFIVYNQSAGALSYDADGSGASAAAPFANVTAGLALQASDFQIV